MFILNIVKHDKLLHGTRLCSCHHCKRLLTTSCQPSKAQIPAMQGRHTNRARSKISSCYLRPFTRLCQAIMINARIQAFQQVGRRLGVARGVGPNSESRLVCVYTLLSGAKLVRRNDKTYIRPIYALHHVAGPHYHHCIATPQQLGQILLDGLHPITETQQNLIWFKPQTLCVLWTPGLQFCCCVCQHMVYMSVHARPV